MAIDGNITENEKDKLIQIGKEIDNTKFDEYYEELVEECEEKLVAAHGEDEFYDIVQECLDKELLNVIEDAEQGVCSRLIIWDLLAIAYGDDDFSKDEKRIIAHVARNIDVDKSILLEMEQSFACIMDIERELENLSVSRAPYCDIRPIVDEYEHRREVLLNAIQELIADELIIHPEIVDIEGKGESFMSSATNFISSTAGTIGDGIATGFGMLTGLFGKKTEPEENNKIDDNIETKKIEDKEDAE